MFLTPQQLLSDLADTLQKQQGALEPFWTSVLNQSQQRAYGAIVQALAARGYLVSQITAWDNGAYYERSLTLFFALSRTGALQGAESKLLEVLDVREDLKTALVIVGGAVVDPQGTAGQVLIGPDSSQGCIFSWPDVDGDYNSPGGPLGVPTRW